EFLNRLKNYNLSDALQKVLDEIPKTKFQVTFCAYIIGLLQVYVRILGGRTESLIKSLVQNAPTNEMKMTMFVGTVLGTIIQTMNQDIGIKITNLVGRYLKTMIELTDHEKSMLSDLLDEVLA
ncbi:MAG: Lrp/AsnC family transcriptional regulator, partial [Thermicanus sp.]|nr:Lrp/AsnC family transcriptional regulator [Thermicanus sp.]